MEFYAICADSLKAISSVSAFCGRAGDGWRWISDAVREWTRYAGPGSQKSNEGEASKSACPHDFLRIAVSSTQLRTVRKE